MSSTTVVPYSVFLAFLHRNIPPLGFPVSLVHVMGAFWGLIAIWTATDFYGAELLVTVLAMMYPAWMSYKADEAGNYPTQWIGYWIIFAAVYLFEFLQFLVCWIPIYQLKMVLFLWCMYPIENNGSVIIYNGALKPCLAALDGWVQSLKIPAPTVEFPKDD